MVIHPLLIEAQQLSTSLIDFLADQHRDWISYLKNQQEIQLYDFKFLDANCSSAIPKCSSIKISKLIELTAQSNHQQILIAQETYKVYSCCLQTIGWGRVRIVICTLSLRQTKLSAAFITNRLDWSPRNILNQWNERDSIAERLEYQTYEKLYQNYSSQLVALS